MFEPHSDVAQIAEAYSLDMVDFAKSMIKLDLDWSDASVEIVEELADALHGQYIQDKPPEDQVRQFWMMIGCYIGEVARKNHRCTWGWVSMDDHRFEGLQARDGKLFWPVGKARARVMTGAEDNLWHDYQTAVLTSNAAAH